MAVCASSIRLAYMTACCSVATDSSSGSTLVTDRVVATWERVTGADVEAVRETCVLACVLNGRTMSSGSSVSIGFRVYNFCLGRL